MVSKWKITNWSLSQGQFHFQLLSFFLDSANKILSRDRALGASTGPSFRLPYFYFLSFRFLIHQLHPSIIFRVKVL